YLAPVRRRTDHDRRGAAILDLPGQTQPVLRARRVGRAAGRIEHQPLYPLLAALPGELAVHHHHAQQAHHRNAGGLYGITLPEDGGSKVVRVKIHKDHQAVTGQPTASLETPTATATVDAEEDAPHKRDETMEIVMA